MNLNTILNIENKTRKNELSFIFSDMQNIGVFQNYYYSFTRPNLATFRPRKSGR